MNKRILAIAIVALLVLTAMPLVAQNNGQTLNIGGFVPLVLELGLTPDAVAQNLPLVGTTANFTQEIAAITIDTNNTAGWQLWVFSENAADLINSDGDTISYTIRFTGSGGVATPVTIPATTGLQVGEATEALDATGENLSDSGDLIIQYNQSETFRAGYYSDQLAVVLRAN